MLEKVKDLRLKFSSETADLIDDMFYAGGFMGRHLAEAARIYAAMLNDQKCTKFLSFPAAIIATGTRGIVVDMIRQGMVDVIITASGTLDHDLARSWGDYYHGSFDLDDVKVKREGYHRLGNVLVPLEVYGPALEKRLQPWLEARYQAGERSLTTERLCNELGELGDESSILYWAKKKGVPIFVPGPMDGAVGSQVWLFANRRNDFRIDVIGDEKRLADITFDSKKSGAVVVGGGISKHHLLWWSQFKGGLDYACYITTATEYDGSLSGAQVKEAISWGKVRARAKKTTLIADATIALPLVAGYALTRRNILKGTASKLITGSGKPPKTVS
ncbi:MAG: deoxyhypusine synthase [Thaumarchaeota archaeon]|nr:deoxyhypusine synthase [Nitrososphaerota archaeon]